MSTVTAPAKVAPLPDDLVTRADVARMFRVSEGTIRSWEQAGRLPAPIRVGRKPFWRAGTITAFLDGDGSSQAVAT